MQTAGFTLYFTNFLSHPRRGPCLWHGDLAWDAPQSHCDPSWNLVGMPAHGIGLRPGEGLIHGCNPGNIRGPYQSGFFSTSLGFSSKHKCEAIWCKIRGMETYPSPCCFLANQHVHVHIYCNIYVYILSGALLLSQNQMTLLV